MIQKSLEDLGRELETTLTQMADILSFEDMMEAIKESTKRVELEKLYDCLPDMSQEYL